MKLQRSRRWAALALAGAALAIGGEALAVVGRPLTPVSYAGVARRTTRRAAYSGAAYGAAAYGGAAYGAAAVGTAAVAGAAAVAALPPGCAAGVACNGVIYRPVYQGTTLVYVPQ
jgi:hypothetical protein